MTDELARKEGLHMANVLVGGEQYSFLLGDRHGDPVVLANPPLDADVVEFDGVTAVVTVPTDWVSILSVRDPVLDEVSKAWNENN